MVEVTEEETAKKVDDKEPGQNLIDIHKSSFQSGETQSTLYFFHPEKKYLLHPQINNPAMTEHSDAWADHFSGELTALNNENNVLESVDYQDFDGFGSSSGGGGGGSRASGGHGGGQVTFPGERADRAESEPLLTTLHYRDKHPNVHLSCYRPRKFHCTFENK